jgi:hypothetical protein
VTIGLGIWAAPRVLSNTYTPDYISDRGHYQTDPHVFGNIDACVISKHAAVRNSKSQFAVPYLAHINLIAHASDFWRDMPF